MGKGKHTYLWAMGALLYWVHYLIFHDPHHIFIYMLGDIAFVPLEVLLVVIVLQRLLHSHEKRALMDKLNIVIGALFSQVGTRLLGELTPAVVGGEEVRRRLAVGTEWSPRDFAAHAPTPQAPPPPAPRQDSPDRTRSQGQARMGPSATLGAGADQM